MHTATTLIHKGAMPIAVHAIRSFARHHQGMFRLRIHSDGSLDSQDQQELLRLAEGIEAEVVTPEQRMPLLEEHTAGFPKTRHLLSRGAYFTKLQIPACESSPFFYFDSDIVWLRRANNLIPPDGWNAFSTESWSWYYGAANEGEWIRAGTPRRVNSGFYYLAEPFPVARLEDMLERQLFDPTIPFNTDQEIMAYLYPKMLYYHPEDLKRTRVGMKYNLAEQSCAALHFPGKMWASHLEAIAKFLEMPASAAMDLRYQDAVPVSRAEFLRMRLYMRLANSSALHLPVDAFRGIRKRFC